MHAQIGPVDQLVITYSAKYYTLAYTGLAKLYKCSRSNYGIESRGSIILRGQRAQSLLSEFVSGPGSFIKKIN